MKKTQSVRLPTGPPKTQSLFLTPLPRLLVWTGLGRPVTYLRVRGSGSRVDRGRGTSKRSGDEVSTILYFFFVVSPPSRLLSPSFVYHQSFLRLCRLPRRLLSSTVSPPLFFGFYVPLLSQSLRLGQPFLRPCIGFGVRGGVQGIYVSQFSSSGVGYDSFVLEGSRSESLEPGLHRG